MCIILTRRTLTVALLSFSVLWAMCTQLVCEQALESDAIVRVRAVIEKIRKEPWPLRTKYAKQLPDLIRQQGLDNIDDKLIDDLATLLADPYDSVRYYAAISLGLIGPRAIPAVPALEMAFKDKMCDQATKTSASAIRLALEKIGVKPPERDCTKVPSACSSDFCRDLFGTNSKEK